MSKAISTPIAAIVLAAGKGTRMQSQLPKVLHPIANRPMLQHTLELAKAVGCAPIVTVAGPEMPAVEKLGAEYGLTAIQREQLGTANAVLAAKDTLAKTKAHLLVLYGDTPLITPETIAQLTEQLDEPNVAVAVLGFVTEAPGAYGRLLVAEDATLEAIVEAKDADEEELEIPFCNSGVMALHKDHAWDLLDAIGNNNAAGEYYLTDAVAVARSKGLTCIPIAGEEEEVLGVNSRVELAQADAILQYRLRYNAMVGGATLLDPDSVYFSADTHIGKDVTIQPHVFFGPNVTLEDGVTIKAFSHLEGCVVKANATVGPMARLRPGAEIGADARIGNFVEIKKATIETGAKISHLSYIGDAVIGANANIGAGTITCNYDGFNKYKTEIGSDAFIGSNTALVAPVKVGSGAMVGAGSVITEDVADDALTFTRTDQTHKEEWAKAFRAKQDKKA